MQFGTVLVIAGLHCFKENIIDWMVETTNIKGNQLWIFTGKTDVEAEALLLWLPDARDNSLEKI